jgi:hypothetical protein
MSEKLDIGRVLNSIFSTYASQASVLLPGALIVFLPIAILNGLITVSLRGFFGFFVAILAIAISLVGTYLFMGMVVQLVRDVQDGRRDSSLGQLFESAVPVLFPLIAAGILAGFGIAIGFLLLIVPGLILLTIWAVVAPSIVVERAGVIDAFGRSRKLVSGHGWQVFGVLVIIFIINFVVSQILTRITIGIAANWVGIALGTLITQVLIAPLSALAAATIYFELRRMKEGAAAPAPAGAPAAGPQPTAPAPPTQPGAPGGAPPAGTPPPGGTPPAGTPPPGGTPPAGTPPPGGTPLPGAPPGRGTPPGGGQQPPPAAS